jgi:hypothetical protein
MWRALAQADGAVDDCAEAVLWALSDDELIASLDATHVLAQRLATVQLALVRELDGRGLAVAQGASSTAVWLRERHRLSGRSAHQLVQLAATIDAAPPTWTTAAHTRPRGRGRAVEGARSRAAHGRGMSPPRRHLRVVASVIRWKGPPGGRRVAARLTAEVSCTGTDVAAPGSRPSVPGNASEQQM